MDDLNESFATSLAKWSELWLTPGLERRVRISWSSRMKRLLGLCIPKLGIVRINLRLSSGPRDLLEEVLCHEVAHLAAYELHGVSSRPHGREWASLMLLAGFAPRPSLCRPSPSIGRPRPEIVRVVYKHYCPVCGSWRLARTAARRWRCASCSEIGLGGDLEVIPFCNDGRSV